MLLPHNSGLKVRCPICGSDMVVSLDALPEPKTVPSQSSLASADVEDKNANVLSSSLKNSWKAKRSPVLPVRSKKLGPRCASAGSNRELNFTFRGQFEDL